MYVLGVDVGDVVRRILGIIMVGIWRRWMDFDNYGWSVGVNGWFVVINIDVYWCWIVCFYLLFVFMVIVYFDVVVFFFS